MSTILFPAGMTVDFHDINMEVMEFYSRGWDLERIQMQKGMFKGSMIAAHTPRMQLFRANYSHGVLLQGDFPKGTILIAFIMTKADITFKNKIAEKHEIKILKSGEEIDFLCNGKSETFTIAVEERFFYERYNAYFGHDFNRYKNDKNIYVDPRSFPFFIQGFKQWMNYLMKDHKQHNIEKLYGRIESEILEYIFSCIYLEDHPKYRQKFDIKIARDLIHGSYAEAANISSLAQELGISERLFYASFKSNYGISPKKYLLGLRMHDVRQALLLSDPEDTTISSVISKYNFFNPSTFTQAYKQMFGELPVERFKISH